MLVDKSKELADTSVLPILSHFLSKSNFKITSECLAKIITTTIRLQFEVAADFGFLSFIYLFFFNFVIFQHLPSNFC